MNINYAIKCPSFDEAFSSSDELMIRVPASSKRDYSHPIDGRIIQRLDSPAINAILKPAIELIADYSQGQIIASSLPVNSASFQEIDRIVNDCVLTLGIKKPYVVIDNSTGFNAYTTGSDEEPFIVLGSILVRVMSPQQLKFVIGHECGHIAMGHVMYHTLVSSASVFAKYIPVIGGVLNSSVGLLLNAWSRRSEITADRAGFLCCGDLEIAKRSLLQIEAGFINADNLNIESYLENSRKFRKRSFLRRVGEYSASHPMLSKRIEALEMFADSEKFFVATGKNAPSSAISEKELERKIEQLLKVM